MERPRPRKSKRMKRPRTRACAGGGRKKAKPPKQAGGECVIVSQDKYMKNHRHNIPDPQSPERGLCNLLASTRRRVMRKTRGFSEFQSLRDLHERYSQHFIARNWLPHLPYTAEKWLDAWSKKNQFFNKMGKI